MENAEKRQYRKYKAGALCRKQNSLQYVTRKDMAEPCRRRYLEYQKQHANSNMYVIKQPAHLIQIC